MGQKGNDGKAVKSRGPAGKGLPRAAWGKGYTSPLAFKCWGSYVCEEAGEDGVVGRDLVHPRSVWLSRPISWSHILVHLISSPQCGGGSPRQ